MMNIQLTRGVGQPEIGLLKNRAIAAVALVAALAAGCTHQTNTTLSSSPSSLEGSNSVALGNAPMVAPHEVRQPPLQPVPVPNLIPATPVSKRLPEVATGRPDPFATLLMAPTVVSRSSSPPAALPAPAVTTPTLPYPTQAPVPTAQPSAGSPPAAIPALPPVSLAQAIEVSGVVQTGSSTSIIVKVPDERTTRYVSVGDRLANGRVLVKRVEMGAEPVVILEQDGAETIKSIGGGAAIGSL
ncbi:MAG TPA: hypothetical protein V6C57_08495 [Coleofasciculaceae cyanobacterium]